MKFQDYFMCRTQRVQLKPDTETQGKLNFGEYLNKKKPDLDINDVLHKINEEELERDEESDEETKNEIARDKMMGIDKDYQHFLLAEKRDEMVFMCETGMNLLIYGVGSKINFLKRLTTNFKSNPMLILNAYHPGITLKSTLKELTNFINVKYVKKCKSSSMKEIHKFFSMSDQIEYILKMLSVEKFDIPKIYLVILSLDAGNLKSIELQRHLSILARCEKIGIIATVDTLKPGAFWDDIALDRYNFAFYQIDTYEEFHLEKNFSTPIFSMKNEREELGLSYILKSFTEYQVKVIQIISKFQLDNPHERGIKEKELYEE